MQRSVTLEDRDILLGLLLEKKGEGRAVLFGVVLGCKIVVGRLERENGVKTCASPLTSSDNDLLPPPRPVFREEKKIREKGKKGILLSRKYCRESVVTWKNRGTGERKDREEER